MDIQEKDITTPNSKLRTFISSYIADALVFAAALLTVVMTFIIIYMLSGQSQLKTLVANIALQHVKAIEVANPKNQETNCEFSTVNLLMLLNLVIVTFMALAKIRKSRIFKGHSLSNMVKIKLFIVATQSYVPLDLNKIAVNLHLFKLTGALLLENATLKKNWIWDILEIDWSDICVTLNDKEMHLPFSLVIPLAYKLKTRLPPT